MNNKILAVVLVLGIASTGFAGISSANNSENTSKRTSGYEQGTKGFSEKSHFFRKRSGFHNLSEEEKLALPSMSDEERKEFFQEKRAEKQAEREKSKIVIDKLIAGESLTASEEALRLELLAKFEDENNNHPMRKGNGDIIAKLLAGDELTSQEEDQLAEMQAKHAEREAQREQMQPIFDKLKAGEQLTDEEQTLLDEHKENMPKKSHRGAFGKMMQK